ncbi:MAG: glycosyltransferase [Actinobacteria bacterium]|nr:glycosyltransferase [Actinomycetota bacterium]
MQGHALTVNSTLPLTIGYSTLANRAKNIKFLKNVENLVVIQNPDGISLPLFGDEINVVELKNKGVAKSRNAAISNADTEYLLFGDDDIEFSESGITSAINIFNSNPHISILLMQAVDETGKLRKTYPTKSHALKLTNSAKAATYEMMVRISDIKSSGIKFDENFGAGVPNYLGDEYIFIADAIRAGLKGQFEPIVIATHPMQSSGSLRNSAVDRSARAKVFTRVFGILAPLMRLLFLIKPPFKKFGFANSILFIFGK